MPEEVEAEGVDVADDGNPMTGVVVSQSLPGWFKPVVIVGTVLTALLAMISLFLAVAYLAPSVARLSAAEEQASERDEQASEQRQQLIDQADVLREQLAQTEADAACRSLYLDDIRRTSGLSQIALSDLFAAVIAADPPLTEAERATARIVNRRLVAQLQAENEPLREALEALDEYNAIDPPPGVCPHPEG